MRRGVRKQAEQRDYLAFLAPEREFGSVVREAPVSLRLNPVRERDAKRSFAEGIPEQSPGTRGSLVDTGRNSFYHSNPMARPPKDKHLLMNVALRIMLTAEQKALIEEAARQDHLDMTAWARPILLRAAKERLANGKATQVVSR
jgi:hypothetical protein